MELIIVELTLTKPVYVCCVYLPPPPDVALVSSLFHHLTLSVPEGSPLLLLGDFNLPDIDWSSLSASSLPSRSLCDELFSLNYAQLVTCPTHASGNTLDLVVTNIPEAVCDLSVSRDLCPGISDHYFIHFYITISKPVSIKNKCKVCFCYDRVDTDGLYLHLSLYSAPPILTTNIDNVWFSLAQTMLESRDLFVSKVRLPTTPSPRWYNYEIRCAIHKVRSLRRRINSKATNYQLDKLSLMERDLQSLIASAKESYLSTMVSRFNNRPGVLFSYLSRLSKATGIPEVVHFGDLAASTPRDKANLFNTFFHSVLTTSNYCLPPLTELPAPSTQLHHLTVSADDVFKKLMNLDTSKAAGIDNLHPTIIKLCAGPLLSTITSLYSTCLMYHTMPMQWKVHKISPVYKSGDRSNVCNYRPISLLCILSKVLESLVYDKIIQFIRPKLSKSHFGFLQQRSCQTQLLSFFADIYSGIEGKKEVDVLYFDFKKAFDTVPHQELLYKLWLIGITGPLWLWFKCYLTDRLHLTCIDGECSQCLEVTSGVPQGSVLGPLLFLVYVNDIPDRISSTIYSFADDMKFLRVLSSFTDRVLLSSDLSSLTNWCVEWNINLNVSKCSHITFSLLHNSTKSSYHIDGLLLDQVETQRDLGVIVSQDLSWSTHYRKICSKAYQTLHMLRRNIPNTADTGLKRVLYLTLVRSQLCYCSQVWSPMYLKDIRVLELVQRRATKYILSNSHLSYKDRLINLNLLPLMYWYDLQDILFLLKCILHPPDNFNIFNYVNFSDTSTRTAGQGKLKYVYKRLSSTRHFYFNRVVRLWNSLPFLDLSLSFNSLKYIIYNHLWNHFLINFDNANLCTYHYVCPCGNCHLIHNY